MKRMKLILSLLVWFAMSGMTYGQDKMMDFLRKELNQQMKELKKQDTPPYYMNYRLMEERITSVHTLFGVVVKSDDMKRRSLVPQIRIGSPGEDNFTYREMGSPNGKGGPTVAQLPIEEDIDGCLEAMREIIWRETQARWRIAEPVLAKGKSMNSLVLERTDKSPSLSPTKIEKYYEEPLPANRLTFDREKWAKRLKGLSAKMKTNSDLITGSANLDYRVLRSYFISTEGSEIVQNLPYATLMISLAAKADDGMDLPMYRSYFAYNPDDLPDDEVIIADIREMMKTVTALKSAPVVDPYTGPVLMSGTSAGVFFHEIFGHRVEGQRMKSDKDGRTFLKKIGEPVLPEGMDVYFDPTLKQYNGWDMNGSYVFDDQGVRGRRVEVVKNGIMNDFLMSRVALEGHPESNGHGRAQGGFDPESRQSNLIVTSKNMKTLEELRVGLLRELKAQGKEFGYFFKYVTGGYTATGTASISSFNVSPIEVYKVFTDGRPDQLVRGVDIVGTPLNMFSNIIEAGHEVGLFSGMCGAGSGWIPVTASSPYLLISKVEVQYKENKKIAPAILERPVSVK